MIFDGQPTNQIMPADLKRLIDDSVQEGIHLDYKREPYRRTPGGTKELIKDVCAFANAEGGYIIIGIEEDGNRNPVKFISIDDPELHRTSIIDRCLARIEERLPFLDVGIVDVDGSSLLIIHIPESGRKPHCTRPDPEHHYFFKRYEDGVKLMSLPEIRQLLESDTVHKALSNIQKQLSVVRDDQQVIQEATIELTDTTLFNITDNTRFQNYCDERFLEAIQNRPYYRLTATPLPLNSLHLQPHETALQALLQNPPQLRQTGWDVTPIERFSYTDVGFICRDITFHHLRLLWNGHLEFWTAADDDSFRWGEVDVRGESLHFLYPYAFIEPVENFILLMQRICEIISHTGQIEFHLSLYNIRGTYLTPGTPGTSGYLHRQSLLPRIYRDQPYDDHHLRVTPVVKAAPELPNEVSWTLSRQVYRRFGLPEDSIPFFGPDHRPEF